MEFSGQYLTYEEYKALGGTLDLTPFNLLEFESRKQIDIKTLNRLDSNNIPQEVKICMFKLINSISSYNKITNVKSESIDGYSVNYTNLEETKDIINNIINDCLFGVMYNGKHLIYCGVKC